MKPSGETLSSVESDRYISQLSAKSSAINSARILYDAAFRSGKEVNAFRYVLVFSAPDSVRLETMPQGAAYTLTLLTSNKGEFRFIDTVEKTAFSGPVSSQAGARAFGLQLTPKLVSYVMLGLLPPEYCLSSSCFFYRSGEELLVVNATGAERFLFNSELQLVKVQLIDPFSSTVDAEIILEGGSLSPPSSVRIKLLEYDVLVDLMLLEAKLNQPVPAHLFDLRIPKSYKRKKYQESSE